MSLTLPENVKTNISLKYLNTWRVGGKAEYFSQPRHFEELSFIYKWAEDNGLLTTLISGGSNVLISDQGIKGLVISMRGLNKVESVDKNEDSIKIVVQAGAAKAELLKVFLKYKLAPALFLAGLPGDVGGGVVMNAGVGEAIEPREFVETTTWVEVLKPNTFSYNTYTKDQIDWGYRHSSGWQPGIITRVGLEWPFHPDPEIMTKIKLATKNRIQRQPLNHPSCGSTFRNPEGYKSGQLIDECGLKGFKIGGAQVSEKHANFIITEEGATAQDVKNLIQHVMFTVKNQKSIELKTEIVSLGLW